MTESGGLELEQFAAGATLPAAFGDPHRNAAYRQGDEPLWGGAEALLACREGKAVGRLSLSLAPDLRGLRGPAGLIGHYEAADPEAGALLLSRGLDRLRALGACIAVGPMNGSTWHRYRLALPGGGGAPFPGEPENRGRYPGDFEAAGFRILEQYESRRVDLGPAPGAGAAQAPGLPERLRRRWRGCSRALRLDRFEEELEAIHALTVEAFDEAVLATPIGLEEFLALYRPLKALYDPELVRLVDAPEGGLRACMVAYRDGKRLVLKTLACRKDSRAGGLGPWLIEDAEGAARARGCTEAIHALMHVDNHSASISRRRSTPFRRYALYARELRP